MTGPFCWELVPGIFDEGIIHVDAACDLAHQWSLNETGQVISQLLEAVTRLRQDRRSHLPLRAENFSRVGLGGEKEDMGIY